MDRFERELQRIEREAEAENAHRDDGWKMAGNAARVVGLLVIAGLVIGIKIVFVVAVLRAIGWIEP
jgi:hypothetical protein